MIEKIAQKTIPLFPPDQGRLQGEGELGLAGKLSAQEVFNKFISGAIGLMTIIAVIWLIFLLLSGAYGIMSSGGDKTALENARKRITTGIIGFVVVVAAIFIIRLMGTLLGIENILNPTGLLETMLKGLGL